MDLAAARALIDRGVDKAESLHASGAFAVVRADGALISASRMDEGGAGGMARAKSKAWISATQKIPSHEHLWRMTHLPAPIAAGFVAASPEARFPGAGGLPIRADGQVVAGFAASGASIGPFVQFPGSVPSQLIVAGKPANVEDLIVAYALDREYQGLHGDDEKRWIDAYGALPDEPGSGHLAPAPASAQLTLAWARELGDRALAAGAPAVAIVDGMGEPWQQDRADGAPAGAAPAALAIAAAAAAFGVPSDETEPALLGVLDVPAAAVAGGLPVPGGGIGIAGLPPAECRALAESLL